MGSSLPRRRRPRRRLQSSTSSDRPTRTSSYYGGTGGDTFGIGASAGNVDNVILYGDQGTDTINSFASSIENVSLVAGSGDADFYNEGNDGAGLSLIGGAGTAVFYNGGPGSTGGNDTHDVTVTAGSGNTAIDSTGTGFGTLTLIGRWRSITWKTMTSTSSSKIVFIGGTGDNTLDNTGNSVGSIVFKDATTTAARRPTTPMTPSAIRATTSARSRRRSTPASWRWSRAATT